MPLKKTLPTKKCIQPLHNIVVKTGIQFLGKVHCPIAAHFIIRVLNRSSTYKPND